jgi:DNA repair protein RecO (recombination protein O)
MAATGVPALILRAFPYGDTSRILRLLTPDHGVIGAIARGARRPRSRFAALLDPFGEGVAVLDYREGRDLQTLTAFDLSRARRGLARDMRRYGAASLLAELLMRTATTTANPSIYECAAAGLDAIEAADGDAIEPVGLSAAWKLVDQLGFGPELDACTICGRRLGDAEEAVFDYGAGGMRCDGCPGGPGARLPARGRAALASMVHGVPPALERTYGHWILLERFLAFHVLDDTPLKSLAFLLEVRRAAAVP